jgi:ATP-dependent Clp protease ATP-binding subunit ClpA
MIVGQDEAIQQIVNIYQMNLTGMSAPGRPIGNFLFLGPTGSGKTRIVEATAEALLKNPRAVIKIDCAEFQHSHEIAKLIGSPPGYLGHRETHPLLSQEVLNQYHTDTMKLSFVLFDEIEKASDALWNLLLGILDKATLTLGDNRKVDFSRAMIFMTSNLGAAEMGNLMSPKLGFGAGAARAKMSTGTVEDGMGEKLARSGVEAARASLRRSSSTVSTDRNLPAARHRAVAKGAGHRIKFSSATHLQYVGGPRVCVHCFRRQ